MQTKESSPVYFICLLTNDYLNAFLLQIGMRMSIQTDIGLSRMGIDLPVPHAIGRVCRILQVYVTRLGHKYVECQCPYHRLLIFFVIFTSLHIRYYTMIVFINYVFYFMLQTSNIILKVIYHLDCFIYTSFFKILIVFLSYAYPVATYIIIHRYMISMDTYIILVSMYNLFYFILQTSDIPFEVVRHLCSYIYLPVSSNGTCIIMYKYNRLLHTHACAGIICTFLKQLVLQQQKLIAEWFEPFGNPRHWWLVRLVNGSTSFVYVPDWRTVRLVNGSNHW